MIRVMTKQTPRDKDSQFNTIKIFLYTSMFPESRLLGGRNELSPFFSSVL